MGPIRRNFRWLVAVVAIIALTWIVTYLPTQAHYDGIAEQVAWEKDIKETRIPGACNAEENDTEAIQATVWLSDSEGGHGLGGLYEDYVLTAAHVVEDVETWNVFVLVDGSTAAYDSIFEYDVIYRDTELDFAILAPLGEGARSVTDADLAHSAMLTEKSMRDASAIDPVSCHTRLVDFDQSTVEWIGISGYMLTDGPSMLEGMYAYLDEREVEGEDPKARQAWRQEWRDYYEGVSEALELEDAYVAISPFSGSGASGSPLFIREGDWETSDVLTLRFAGIVTGGFRSPMVEADEIMSFIPMTEICPRAEAAGIDLCGEAGPSD